MLSVIKKTVLDILDHSCRKKSAGIDDYIDREIYHPMADALLLRSLCVLHEASLISSARLTSEAKLSVARLEADLEHYSGRGWGLGFAWKNADDKEVYSITTSLVMEALLSVKPYVPVQDNTFETVFSYLCSDAIFKVKQNGLTVPVFSEAMDFFVANASAKLCSVVLRANILGACSLDGQRVINIGEVLGFITKRCDKSYGWGYSLLDCDTYDFLHQAYIVEALHDAGEAYSLNSRDLLLLVDSYRFGDGFVDKVVSYESLEDALSSAAKVKSHTLLPFGDGMIVRWAKPARAWELGAMLAAISKVLGSKTVEDVAYIALKQRALLLAEVLVQDMAEQSAYWEKPRVMAHVLYGLSCYMQFRRAEVVRRRGDK